MFTSIQQKEISGFLTMFWQTDPFKAKWTILAKAYSNIRDTKGKDTAPLDMFLTLSAPHIGIVPPLEYLNILGWRFSRDEDGQMTLVHDGDSKAAAFSQNLTTTNLSVEDIIQHCCNSGYISVAEATKAMAHGSTMTMASTAQHVQSQENASSPSPNSVGIDSKTSAENDFESQLVEDILKELGQETAQEVVAEEVTEEVTNHAALLGNDVFGQFLQQGGDEFPYNSQFSSADFTELHYDPYMGDNFNAFDMSEYLNEEMFSAE